MKKFFLIFILGINSSFFADEEDRRPKPRPQQNQQQQKPQQQQISEQTNQENSESEKLSQKEKDKAANSEIFNQFTQFMFNFGQILANPNDIPNVQQKFMGMITNILSIINVVVSNRTLNK